MVIYRSVTLNHSCSGGSCTYCTTGYGEPPPNPETHMECCRYTENGERVIVVYVDVPLELQSAPKRPSRTGTRATAGKASAKKLRDVELQPKAPARKATSRTRSSSSTHKPATSKTNAATRRGKTR